MHEPLVGVVFGVFAEDDERFFTALFSLQLASVYVNLQRAGQVQRFFLRDCGLVLAIEGGQYFCLGVLVVAAIFIFDGFVGIDQRIIEGDLFRQQVIRGVVP